VSYISSRFFTARFFGALFFGTPAELVQVTAMGNPLAVRSWYSGLLTDIVSPIDLATLVKDLYAGLPQPLLVADITASELKILAPAANTKNVLVGDEQLGIVNFGDSIAPAATREWGPFNVSRIPLANIFVMSADGVTPVALGIQAFVG